MDQLVPFKGYLKTVDDLIDLDVTQLAQGAVTEVLYYNEPSDGGGGTFAWDRDAIGKPDKGVVFMPNSVLTESMPGRWKRIYSAGMVNVKWFGATGKLTDDDTFPIQRAIDRIADVDGGGVVFFPVGVYHTTGTLKILKSSVALVGEVAGVDASTLSPASRLASRIWYTGPNMAVYIWIPAPPPHYLVLNNNEIRALTIDAPYGSCIYAENAAFLKFDNIRCRAVGEKPEDPAISAHYKGGYFLLLKHCEAATLQHVNVQGDVKGNGIIAIGQSNGLRLFGCRICGPWAPTAQSEREGENIVGLLVDDCSCCYVNAIFEHWKVAVRIGLVSSFPQKTTNVKLDNCYFEIIDDRAVYVGNVENVDVATVFNVSIIDCYANLEATRNAGRDGAFAFRQVTGARFEGNCLVGKKERSYYFLWYGANCKNVSVRANTFIDTEPKVDCYYYVHSAATGVFQKDNDGSVYLHNVTKEPYPKT